MNRIRKHRNGIKGKYRIKMTPVAGMLMVVLLSLSMAGVSCQRVLCGKTLADTLDLVCAGRGFHFNKRSADTDADATKLEEAAKSGTKPAAAETGGSSREAASAQQQPASAPARQHRSVGSGAPGQTRSVVDECCRRACTYTVLESYCAPANDGIAGSEDDLMHLFGGAGTRLTTRYTTTPSTTHYDPNSPSAEVFRGPARGSSFQHGRKFPQQFFYVQVASRPTRNPLITE